MARYRQVDPRIWGDERFMTLGEGEKLLVLYILTSTQTNRIGCFRFSPGMAAEDLGCSLPTLTNRLETVCHTLRWTFVDGVRLLLIPTWLEYQPPANPNQLQSWSNDYHELPDHPLKAVCYESLSTVAERWPERFAEWFGEPFGNGIGNQEQEQEQEQEQDNPSCSEPGKPASEPLLTFPVTGNGLGEWGLSPAKLKEYCETYPAVGEVAILAALRQARQWCRDNPAKRKTPRGMPRFLAGWLERANNRGDLAKAAKGGNGAPPSRKGESHHLGGADWLMEKALEVERRGEELDQ